MAAGGGRSSLAVVAFSVLMLHMAAGISGGGAGSKRVAPAAAEPSWPPAPHAVVVSPLQRQPDECRRGATECYTSIGKALAQAGRLVPKVKHRFVVLIKTGEYREQVNITRRNVVLLGEGRGNTVITGSLSNRTGTPMYFTGTVNALADGFLAQNLTIRNEAGASGKQAVALRSNSNRTVVFGCSIEGYEDTLYAENGLQLYLETDVYGTVDFVYGNAKAVFQRCRLRVRQPLPNKHNVLTAQGCDDEHYKDSGFVFHRCKVEADPNPSPPDANGGAPHAQNLTGVETYLGRPHKRFSHVVFMQSELGAVVHPDGWAPWAKGHVIKETTESVNYIEFGNTGPGADTSRRVKWSGVHAVTDAAKVAMYAADNFVAAEEWVPKQIPYNHELPR